LSETDCNNPNRTRWEQWLDEWKALVLPAAGALAVAFVHYLGYVAMSGQRRALGVSALTVPALSEKYIFFGVGILISITITTIYILAPTALMVWLAKKMFHYLPSQVTVKIETIRQSKSFFWAVFVSAILVGNFAIRLSVRLFTHTEGILLKPPSEVGRMWMRVSFDSDKVWIVAYQMLFMGVLVLFIVLNVWLFNRFGQRLILRVLYVGWASIITITLFGTYAFFIGASNTTEDYPVVGYSGIEEMVGSKDTLVVLLDSDEKLYALLAIYPDNPSDSRSHMRKTIIYLPIAQVKWLAVVRQMRLYDVVHYADIRNLSPGQ